MDVFLGEGSLINTPENAACLTNLAALKEACAAGTVLEQQAALFDKNKNLIVHLGPIKGVMPHHECAVGIAEGFIRDIAIISRVGKPVCFAITGFSKDERGTPVALLSRRAVQQAYLEQTLKFLRPGDIIPCRATHLERFGCFVDIGRGISALLPIDAISVSRISHPGDRIRVGAELKCVVKTIDAAGRLLLSHKELLGTWEQNAALFSPGETVMGTVRSVETYGIFIELSPNLTGLADLIEGIEIGRDVSVFIKSIIPERMKIKLVIIDVVPSGRRDPAPFHYFIESGHLDHFVYSPSPCTKIIETVFR